MSNGNKLKIQGDQIRKQREAQQGKITDRMVAKANLQTKEKKSKSPPPLDKAYPLNNLNKLDKLKALKAQEQYNTIHFFYTPYNELTKAAENSMIGLKGGKLTLDISAKQLQSLNIPKLVKDTMLNQLKGKVEDAVLTKVLGKKATAWVGLLKELSNLQKQLANEKLVGAVGKEADKKRFEAKIRLLTAVMAIGVVKQLWRYAPRVKGYNPNAIQLELHNNYWNYDKAYRKYSKYIFKDKVLELKRKDPKKFEHLRREPNKYERP